MLPLYAKKDTVLPAQYIALSVGGVCEIEDCTSNTALVHSIHGLWYHDSGITSMRADTSANMKAILTGADEKNSFLSFRFADKLGANKVKILHIINCSFEQARLKLELYEAHEALDKEYAASGHKALFDDCVTDETPAADNKDNKVTTGKASLALTGLLSKVALASAAAELKAAELKAAELKAAELKAAETAEVLKAAELKAAETIKGKKAKIKTVTTKDLLNADLTEHSA
jgi:hypothetical protein